MDAITYQKMDKEQLCKEVLNHFSRYQQVRRCWRRQNDEWVLVDNPYIEDWDFTKKCSVIENLKACIEGGGFVFGAVDGNKIIGFASVSADFFGSDQGYVELLMLHVSTEYRGRGIGRRLFMLMTDSAKKMGAKKLYISANSSEESQAFYRKNGCVDAVEVNQTLAQNEPFDCQMEYVL